MYGCMYVSRTYLQVVVVEGKEIQVLYEDGSDGVVCIPTQQTTQDKLDGKSVMRLLR